ncbi:hypothetical protein [Haliangium sp.]|uniref:hypothetical protein n=1 Tax=Haliangium sp. TaxID=2663208 RepID=UPI003D0DDABC
MLAAVSACAGGRGAGGDDPGPADGSRGGGVEVSAPAESAPAASDTPNPPAAAAAPAPAAAARPGSLTVQISWLDAPARVRRSPGRNRCGAERPPWARVHALGGVADVAVVVRRDDEPGAPAAATPGDAAPAPTTNDAADDPADSAPGTLGAAAGTDASELVAAPGATSATVAIAGCVPGPRVLVAGTGAGARVVNDDAVPRRLAITRVAAADGQAAEPGPATWARLPMVGSQVLVDDMPAGIYRLAVVPERARADAPGFDAAYVLVPGAARAAVTNPRGMARFDRLAPGRYQVSAWYPALDDAGAPRDHHQVVTVRAGKRERVTIPLFAP